MDLGRARGAGFCAPPSSAPVTARRLDCGGPFRNGPPDPARAADSAEENEGRKVLPNRCSLLRVNPKDLLPAGSVAAAVIQKGVGEQRIYLKAERSRERLVMALGYILRCPRLRRCSASPFPRLPSPCPRCPRFFRLCAPTVFLTCPYNNPASPDRSALADRRLRAGGLHDPSLCPNTLSTCL